ncbi:unnamed protein product, partial [Gulo gulo]
FLVFWFCFDLVWSVLYFQFFFFFFFFPFLPFLSCHSPSQMPPSTLLI